MSGHWAYVTAAYALTAALTLGVLFASWRAMRGAEARADALGRGRR